MPFLVGRGLCPACAQVHDSKLGDGGVMSLRVHGHAQHVVVVHVVVHVDVVRRRCLACVTLAHICATLSTMCEIPGVDPRTLRCCPSASQMARARAGVSCRARALSRLCGLYMVSGPKAVAES